MRPATQTRLMSTLVAVLATACQVRQPPEVLTPSLTYRMAPEFSLHQPVVVEIILVNSSASSVDAQLGRNRRGRFHLHVGRPDGTFLAIEPGAIRTADELSTPGGFVLASGERYADRILLNEWSTFDQVGDYSLRITFDGSLRVGDQDVAVNRDVVMAFRVIPRSETLLVDTAAHLLDTIKVDPDPMRRWQAAQELSYMTDSTAVHYLARAIEVARGPGIEDVAIDALARIGNEQARRALEKVANGPRYEAAARARGALGRLDAMRR